MIQMPEINPTFFYGPIIAYKFVGDVSKDKGKYRIRFILTFKSGDTYNTQKSGYETKSAAQKAKDVLIAELVRKEYVPFDYTVKEVFDYWLYYHALKEKKIRYNTFNSYRNVLYNHLLPALGEKKKIKQVGIEDIVNAVNGIRFPSIKEASMRIIKQLFAFAFKKYYITFNPSIAALESLKQAAPKKCKRNVEPYTVEEIKFLLYTCKENFQEMYLPLLLSLTIGTRISETVGLMYSDIDFTAETIYIRRQLGNDIDYNGDEELMTQKLDTKTPNGVRSIPVPSWVLDEIIVKRAKYERQKQLIPGFRDMGYVCCHCDGRPFHRNSFLDDFNVLINMCGLRKVHWHDLRHMYATVLKNNSVNMKAVSEFLGHYSPDFTEDVYVYQAETAYDCSMLEDWWESIRPENEEEMGMDELFLPFTDEDYISLVS